MREDESILISLDSNPVETGTIRTQFVEMFLANSAQEIHSFADAYAAYHHVTRQ